MHLNETRVASLESSQSQLSNDTSLASQRGVYREALTFTSFLSVFSFSDYRSSDRSLLLALIPLHFTYQHLQSSATSSHSSCKEGTAAVKTRSEESDE